MCVTKPVSIKKTHFVHEHVVFVPALIKFLRIGTHFSIPLEFESGGVYCSSRLEFNSSELTPLSPGNQKDENHRNDENNTIHLYSQKSVIFIV
jgi:hypothetical protein